MRTLRAQALLITTLLQEGYESVLTARFQTDPLERRFSRYRQMNGGSFLASLRKSCLQKRHYTVEYVVEKRHNCWHDDQTTKSLSEETTQHLGPNLISCQQKFAKHL